MQILSTLTAAKKLSGRMLALTGLSLLSACGGGSDIAVVPPTATNFSIGGTIAGLSALGVVLANGSDTLALGATATTFNMPTAVTRGTSYSVVLQQVLPGTNCTVANGSGTVASANVTNVALTCANGWAWMNGANTSHTSNLANASGTYGTQGVAAPGNVPGARIPAATWVDSVGNLWLMGGYGVDAAGATGRLGDLWKYSPATGLWTWVSGTGTLDTAGLYGTQGVASAANRPGARETAFSWMDASGNLWLFGGIGKGAGAGAGELNDLWKFSPTTGEWTWVAGTNGIDSLGTYGTLGVAGAANTPGGRDAGVTWIDGSGNLWLMGGNGFGASGAADSLNDHWKFSPTLGQWAWMGGSTATGASGSYGTRGVAAPANTPGARYTHVAGIDTAGNFWLMGGYGADSVSTTGYLNDLWKYSPATGQWTWVSGSNLADPTGNYGTQGVASASNAPAAKSSGVGWVDKAGNFWAMGGLSSSLSGNQNDLWKYSPSTDQWTWVSGANTGGASATYGTRGASATANTPGGRYSAGAWIDTTGNLWLMGGYGKDSTGTDGYLNDLWRY